MKTKFSTNATRVAAVAALLALTTTARAIEGLQIAVQCPNVVLSWPSVEGETYLVQRSWTLGTNADWVTLTDFLPAESGTNVTIFVDSNEVDCASGGPMGPGPSMAMGQFGASAMEASSSDPLAKAADGSGDPVPLSLYPPTEDRSLLLILDPSSSQWINGADYTNSAPDQADATFFGFQSMDDPSPGGGGGGGGGSDPSTAFYRVVRDGAHLWMITNGMNLSGKVILQVEVGNAQGYLTDLTLEQGEYVNDPIWGYYESFVPVPSAPVRTQPFSGPLQINLDTTEMSNGVCDLSVFARWEDTNGGVWEAQSPPVTVNVTNEISFPNWMGSFGDYDYGYGTNWLYIEAESAHTNAQWYIDVYDSHYTYIGTLEGTTTNGVIEAEWDLVGPYGDTHYNDPFFAFVVSTVFSDPDTASAVPPPIYRVTDPWPGPGVFVVAAQHAFDNINDHETLYSEIDGFIGPAQGCSGTSVLPPPQGTDDAGLPMAFGIHFETSDPTDAAADWATFRSALYNPNSRNLIYFGHGGPDGIGYSSKNTNYFVSASEIGAMLGTTTNTITTNRHAFRFVFLDGCNTAAGTLPQAFGILKRENVPAQTYYNSSKRPSAFVGWSAVKYVGFLNGLIDKL